MSKKELTDIKSDILDIQRDIKTLAKRMDEITVYFENHGHIDQKITGPSVFLQELYDKKVRQAQQSQQGPPQPVPPPMEKEETAEE